MDSFFLRGYWFFFWQVLFVEPFTGSWTTMYEVNHIKSDDWLVFINQARDVSITNGDLYGLRFGRNLGSITLL